MMKSIWAIFAVLSFTVPAYAINEEDLPVTGQANLELFLKGLETFKFTSKNAELQGLQFRNPIGRETIVFLPGMSETAIKYQELFYDLYQKGFSIISYDHRSQGASTRLSKRNAQIVHVDSFSDYTDDLKYFMAEVLPKRIPQGMPVSLIAHSMGGAIAAQFLETQRPCPFRKAVLSAPMLAIKTEPYPEILVHLLVEVLDKIGRGDAYAPGQKDYNPRPFFDKNKVTHSFERFNSSVKFLQENESYRSGGVSNRWIASSLDATRLIRQEIEQIEIPVLMLAAGDEQFTINSTLQSACIKLAGRCSFVETPNAKHELFMESDPFRKPIMEKVTQFLEPESEHKP